MNGARCISRIRPRVKPLADDLRTRSGTVGIWMDLDGIPIAAAFEAIGSASEAGFRTVWVPEGLGREPFAFLGAAFSRYPRLTIGVAVASIYARGPVTARSAAYTLDELSRRRFILGLGVSHRPVVEAVRGIPYLPPVDAMKRYLEVLRTSTNPRADYQPAVTIAALRNRMARLGAKQAGGVFPLLISLHRTRMLRELLDSANPGSPRPWLGVVLPVRVDTNRHRATEAVRSYLGYYTAKANYVASFLAQGLSEADVAGAGSERLVHQVCAVGDHAGVGERIRSYHEAGADHVAIVPIASDGSTHDHSQMVLIAELLGNPTTVRPSGS
jgi:probable F420-dependent oxidoreductase